jgi:hypothetical protein
MSKQPGTLYIFPLLTDSIDIHSTGGDHLFSGIIKEGLVTKLKKL